MTSKTITVREEAYYALKSLQLKDESFSDTILRISNQFSNLKESVGTGTKTKEEYEIELDELSTRRENFFQGRI
jgi:predicted CopG family antitoxin